MNADADAVVIGAGHNGLASAIVLARAGWDVVVCERNESPGGAIRTEEVTLPGYRHDLFAANLNLFMGSAFFAEFGDDLARHGFSVVTAQRAYGSVFPDGRFLGVEQDPEATRASLAQVDPDDAEAWEALHARFAAIAPHLFPLLGVPLPSVAAVRGLLRGTRALGRRWPLDLARLLAQSPRELFEEHFVSPEVQALCAAWGMHLDFPPSMSGGALFPFLESQASAANGMALGRGGAGTLIAAMVGLLEEKGGEVRCGAPVDRVMVDGGRALGVQLVGGERLRARRAVIGNVTPQALFGQLIPPAQVPDEFERRVRAFRHGPATFMLHLAMSDLPDWSASAEARDYAYIHVAGYLEDMDLAYVRAVAGRLPEHPTLVVGQPTAVDPTRAPDGEHVLWVQVRQVPSAIHGDAAGEIEARSWDEAKEPYADRILDLIEAHAPGTRDKVRARSAWSPADLEAADPNLVGGDSLAGSHHLMQHFFLRPVPGWSRYRTPIDGLYLCGAATWPGAGVGAGSGHLLGQQLTRSRTRRRR
ncbi:NAD(P)/FAD-dependent oxidoreductase [Egibacter rhizosphaerae]|uniref:Pyridine nucleotide-disulfide oxidoreductase domain-containing protein 2 n=1 Tax=Egibacter rhizosphaerae TaxID=1670831 RepID=A0A411YGX2_9ACTN|nr:NAD(P)/FAD-dependent oxidoreductase [Egibacter rhizosphaerae]QBI20399.1 NAD(P)/FAD-dependent oxidoreductase [Egibacter rhizosphaerae]